MTTRQLFFATAPIDSGPCLRGLRWMPRRAGTRPDAGCSVHGSTHSGMRKAERVVKEHLKHMPGDV
jgi:hypothetical protein